MQKSGIGKKSQLFYRAKVRILEAHGLNAVILKEIYDTFTTGLEMCQGEDRDMLVDELGDFHFERLPELIGTLQMEDDKNRMKHEKVMYLKLLLGVHLSFEELRAYSPQHLYSIRNRTPLLSAEEIAHITELEELDESGAMDKSSGSGMMRDDEEDGDYTAEDDEEEDEEEAQGVQSQNHSMMSDDEDGATLEEPVQQPSPQPHMQQTNGGSFGAFQEQNRAPFSAPLMSLDDMHNQLHHSGAQFSLYDDNISSHSNFSETHQQHPQYSQQSQPQFSQQHVAPPPQSHYSHVALMQNIRASFPPSAASRFSLPGASSDTTFHTREAMLDIGSMFQGPLDDEFDNYFEQKKEQRHIKREVQNAQSSQQRMPLQSLGVHSLPNNAANGADDISLNLSQTFTGVAGSTQTFTNPVNRFAAAAHDLSFNIREDTQDITKQNLRRLSSELTSTTTRRSSLAPNPHQTTSTLDFSNNPATKQRRFSTMPTSRSKKVSFGGASTDNTTLSGIGERIKAEATHHRKSIASSMNIISKQNIDSVAPMLAQLFRSTRISPEEQLGYNTQIFQLLWKYHTQQQRNDFKLLNEKTMPNMDTLRSKIGKVSPIQIADKEVIVNYCRETSNNEAVYELDDAQEGLCWLKAQALSRCVWEFYIMKQIQQRIIKEDVRQCFLQPQKLYALTNAPNSLGYILTNAPQSYPINTFIECYQSNQQLLPEHLVMYFTVELLKVLGKLHALGFTANASFAAEHLFLRLQLNKHVQVQWSASGFPQCGILLTNFADFTDFSLFLQGGAATLDHLSLCHLIHLLLTNEVLSEDDQSMTGYRYKPFKSHMYQNELWQELFDTLLLGEEGAQYDLSQSMKQLARLRKLFEEYLESSKKDKIYKALVNANGRVKRWVSEQRRKV